MKLYTIFDRLAEESGPIFEAKNNTVALRMYKQVNMPGNPDDYRLFYIGCYDRDKMQIRGAIPEEVVDGTMEVEDK